MRVYTCRNRQFHTVEIPLLPNIQIHLPSSDLTVLSLHMERVRFLHFHDVCAEVENEQLKQQLIQDGNDCSRTHKPCSAYQILKLIK